ncbi:MAG: hypothetical protein ACI9TH_002328 [Kiritimatiellia bacterium]|jgi:hypothetical protein
MKRLLLLMPLLLTGCVDFSGLMRVKSDGSGLISIKIYQPYNNPKSIQAQKQARKGQGFFDQLLGNVKDTAQSKLSLLYNPANPKQIQQLAGIFGPDVKLVKHTGIKRSDGTPGVLAEFSFPDVTKLEIGPQALGPTAPAERTAPPWAYRFIRDPATGRLTLVPPNFQGAEGALSVRESMMGADQIPGFENILRVAVEEGGLRFQLQVDDKITASSSAYPRPELGNIISLANIRFSTLVKEIGFEGLMDLRSPADLKKFSRQQTPGLMMEDPVRPLVVAYE